MHRSNGRAANHKSPKQAQIGLFCLECAAILVHVPLTVRSGLGTKLGR
jgi:hypothetical protein